MHIVVQKYGGSSLSSLERIRVVAEKVVARHRAGERVVVVVSAMGDTTDELLSMARDLTASPSRRELDMLLSVGERVSMALLSIAIQALGVEAISFTGSQVGLLTTDDHARARIVEVRPFRVEDELKREKIVIVAGFQGTSYRREVTTLGRGGSDTTAVALAAALGATHCDIYSDVDGVYSADPRVVVNASRLDQLDYEEMQELARQGARVLNAEAVEFARRKGIALYARSSFSEHSGHSEIRRVDGADAMEFRRISRWNACSVASRKDVVLVSYSVASTGENRTAELLDALQGQTLLHLQAVPGQSRCDLLLRTENLSDVEGWAAGLRRQFPDVLSVSRDLATVAVVGSGIGDFPEAVAHAWRTLATAGVWVRSVVASRDALTLVVNRVDTESAVQALHSGFIDG